MLCTGFQVLAIESEAASQEALTTAPSLLQELEGMTAEEFAKIPKITGEPIEESGDVSSGESEGIEDQLTNEDINAISEWNQLKLDIMAEKREREDQVRLEQRGLIENNPEESQIVIPANSQTNSMSPAASLTAQNKAPMLFCYNNYTVLLKQDGTVWTWGSYFNTIYPTYGPYSKPKQIDGLDSIISVSGHLALKSDGTVWRWGTDIQQVSDLTSVVAIASNDTHSFAIKSDGTLWGWGSNTYGQLGNGTTTGASNPIEIPIDGIVSIVPGYNFTIALKNDGTVWAWGKNDYGQLGNGNNTNQHSPVSLGLTDVTEISAGYAHALAKKADGTVWAWGYGRYGQLGIGTTDDHTQPVQIPGLESVQSISSGNQYNYAKKSDGSMWAWGANSFGQLGDGTTVNQNSPVAVMGMDSVISVSCGTSHVAVLKTDGSVWVIGANGSCQLGDGKPYQALFPQKVFFTNDAKTADLEEDHGLVVKEDGTVWAWGENKFGQLGIGTTQDTTIPMQIKSADGTGFFSGAIAVEAYGSTNYILKDDGTVWRLSSNVVLPTQISGSTSDTILTGIVSMAKNLALKDDGTVWTMGTTTSSQVAGIDSVKKIAKDSLHSMALKTDGTVWVWGGNQFGQLGDGTTVSKSTPQQVSGLTDVQDIAAGYGLSLAVKNDGTVWAWGWNSYGQVGNDSQMDVRTPTQVIGESGTGYLQNVVRVSAGFDCSYALKSDGTVCAWGNNMYGQLGIGNQRTKLVPVPVQSSNGGLLTGVIELNGTTNKCLAVRDDGSMWVWGENSNLALGDAVRTDLSLTWVRVLTMTSKITMAISAGKNGYVLKSDGTVWGTGYVNQSSNNINPVQIGPGVLENIVKICGKTTRLLALKNDGTVWEWTSFDPPQQVLGPNGVGFLTNIVDISAYNHCLALKSDGTVWGWGANGNGELGDGTLVTPSYPVQVKNPSGSGALTDITKIDAGYSHSLAVNSDGTLWAWGLNLYGQLGNDDPPLEEYWGDNKLLPVQVEGENGIGILDGVIDVASGIMMSYALRNDGTVWQWGMNISNLPIQVETSESGYLSGITKIFANDFKCFGIKADGSAFSWGYNTYGELGVGNENSILRPTQMLGEDGTSHMTDVSSIGTGEQLTFVLQNDGTLYACGYNQYGEFGIGSSNNRTDIPVRAYTKYMYYDDYGNDFSEATEVFVNKTVTGEINYASDVDCFKFSVPFEDGYLFKSTGIIVPAVYNEDYEPICALGPTAFNLVPNKTYYVKVTGPVNAYSFTIIQPTNTLYIADASLLEGTTGETELEHLQEGFVRAKIHIVNEHIMNKRFAVLVALVNKDTNAYIDHTVVDKMLGGGGSEYMTVGFNIPEDAQDYKIVIQLWDSMLTMNLLGSEWVLQ